MIYNKNLTKKYFVNVKIFCLHLCLLLIIKKNIMNGVLDIKSPNWLFGNNVHNTLIIIGVGLLVYKAYKK
jgi:hypothetical protein